MCKLFQSRVREIKNTLPNINLGPADVSKHSAETHKCGFHRIPDEGRKYLMTQQTHFTKILLYAAFTNLTIPYVGSKLSDFIKFLQEKNWIIFIFNSKKLTSTKTALLLVKNEKGYWRTLARAIWPPQRLLPWGPSTLPNGDWEEGICPNHLHKNQAKLFQLFACHGYIKAVCVVQLFKYFLTDGTAIKQEENTLNFNRSN